MYLFFVRHFNDVDHIAPVVWKMKRDDFPVAIYCMNPRYDIAADYRLSFLKNEGVTVDYIHNHFHKKRTYLHSFIHSLGQWCFAVRKTIELRNSEAARIGRRWTAVLMDLTGSLLYKLSRNLYYDSTWANHFLRRTQARALCFDYVSPRLYVVDVLLKEAKALSIPSFALPHGVYLYTNQKTKRKSTESRRLEKFNRFDYIIAPNPLRREILVRSGVGEEKIAVLGTPRYSREWLKQNQEICPRVLTSSAESNQKLKVVFMMSKPQCRIDKDRVLNTFKTLSGLSEVEARIKPHTRTRGSNRFFRRLELPHDSRVLTAELCEWADVVLVVGSSVITEALARGKPALYLKYLHANTTLFEDLGACWTIGSEADLETALKSLMKDKVRLPYKTESVGAFLQNVVSGGASDGDVLGRYEKFVVERSSQ